MTTLRGLLVAYAFYVPLAALQIYSVVRTSRVHQPPFAFLLGLVPVVLVGILLAMRTARYRRQSRARS